MENMLAPYIQGSDLQSERIVAITSCLICNNGTKLANRRLDFRYSADWGYLTKLGMVS